MAKPNNDRELRIRKIIDRCRAQLYAGEVVDDKAILAASPELAPELAAELTKVRRIHAAAQQADAQPPERDLAMESAGSPETTPFLQVTPSPTNNKGGPTLKRLRYVGDYELIREIARGGMGIVYEALQVSLNRRVAVKMIREGQLVSADDAQRFRSEAEVAARLRHPNIVQIFEIGDHEGLLYFSMELIVGPTLQELIRENPLPPRQAAAYLAQVTTAISYAHTAGVLHRDLKPGNVLIDAAGQIHVTDFGLAKCLEGDQDLTRTGQILGTPNYMPPEQAQGQTRRIGPASDVYSLGAVLYALLTGRPPFQSAAIADTLSQVASQPPVHPRTLNPGVPRDLETICLKCLEKEPERRYATAELLGDDLQRFLSGKPVLARPIGPLARTWRWAKRQPWQAAALVLLAILAVGSPPVAWQQYSQRWQITKQRDELQRSGTRIAGLLVTKEAALGRAASAERDAIAAQQTAEAEALTSFRRSYISDMERMDGLWQVANLQTMRELLARYLPAPGRPELRDFEWYYWQRQCQLYRIKMSHEQAVEQLVVAPTGPWLATNCPQGVHSLLTIWNTETAEKVKTRTVPRTAALRFVGEPPELAMALRSGARQKWNWRADELTPLLPAAGPAPLASEPSRESFALASDGQAPFFSRRNRVLRQSADAEQPVELPGELQGVFRSREPTVVRDEAVGIDPLVIQRFAKKTYLRSDEFAPPPEEDGGPVFAFALSANEQRLAAGSRHGELVVWNATDGVEQWRVQAHDDLIWDAVFSPDGQFLATGSKDGLVKVWNAELGLPIATFSGHRGAVRAIAFGQDGLLASGGDDQVVRLWHAQGTLPFADFRGHERPIADLQFAPDGQTLWSTGRDGAVLQWPLAAIERPIVVADRSLLYSVDSYKDGRSVAASGMKNEITVWDVGTGHVKQNLSKNRGVQFHLRVTTDGREVQSIGSDAPNGVFSRWDAESGALLFRRELPTRFWIPLPDVAISPDGRFVAAYCADNQLRVFATDRDQEPVVVKLSGPPVRVLFTPDSKKLLTMCPALNSNWKFIGPGPLQLWNVETGQLVEEIARDHLDFQAAFSSDGNLLAYTRKETPGPSEFSYATEIVVWDRNAKTVRMRLSIPQDGSSQHALAFSPDGSHLALLQMLTSNSMGKRGLFIWNLTEGRFSQLDDRGLALAFAKDGRSLFVASSDARVRQWRLSDGKKLRELVRPAGAVTSITYSPWESKLATISIPPNRDGTLVSDSVSRTWISRLDAMQQEQNLRFQLVGRHKWSITILPDGNLAYRGNLWQLATWDETLARRFKLQLTAGYPEAVASGTNCVFTVIPADALSWSQSAPLMQADQRALKELTDAVLTRSELRNGGLIARSEQKVPAGCTAVAATRDGRLVALAVERQVQVWDGVTLKRLCELDGHTDFVRTLAFSDDGKWLASAGLDRAVRLWSTADGALRGTFFGHSQPITCIVFTPLGRSVVSASLDGTVRLWDVATGLAKTTFVGHTGPVHWLEFSPEGDELASAGEDGTVHLWKAPGAAPPPRANIVSRAADGEWTTNDGKFRVLAELVNIDKGIARLEKPDGTMLAVPLARLCAGDRAFVASRGSGDPAELPSQTPAVVEYLKSHQSLREIEAKRIAARIAALQQEQKSHLSANQYGEIRSEAQQLERDLAARLKKIKSDDSPIPRLSARDIAVGQIGELDDDLLFAVEKVTADEAIVAIRIETLCYRPKPMMAWNWERTTETQPIRLVVRGPLVSRFAVGAGDFERGSPANLALRFQPFRVAGVEQRGNVPHYVLEPFSLAEVRAWQRAETQRLKAMETDPVKAGSVWTGTRTYRKGFWAGKTVPYELHVVTRRGPKVTGHVFDNGPGRNRAEVTGEINGEAITWREQSSNPANHVNVTAQFSGDAINLTLQGKRTDGTIYTEGDGELKLVPGR